MCLKFNIKVVVLRGGGGELLCRPEIIPCHPRECGTDLDAIDLV